MPQPVLSIITVCRNSREKLSSTMEDVLRQTWTQYEYLIIDGNSGDGTKELLPQWAERFAQKGISFSYVSEPDQGIYDAMNKGAGFAKGQWLLFLNAGDLMAEKNTLEKVFRGKTDAQILYGDTVCVYQGNRKLYPALPLPCLTREMAFCHQSAFVRRELLLEQPYDRSYRICADHHFFLSMYLKGKTFSYVGFPVAVYEIAGYSDKNKLQSHREQIRMQKELCVFRPTPAWLLRECGFYLKQGVKTLFGQALIDLVRRKRLR